MMHSLIMMIVSEILMKNQYDSVSAISSKRTVTTLGVERRVGRRGHREPTRYVPGQLEGMARPKANRTGNERFHPNGRRTGKRRKRSRGPKKSI